MTTSDFENSAIPDPTPGTYNSVTTTRDSLSRPLWVIAFATSLIAVLSVILFAAVAYTYLAARSALSEFSDEYTESDTPGAESSGANQPETSPSCNIAVEDC